MLRVVNGSGKGVARRLPYVLFGVAVASALVYTCITFFFSYPIEYQSPWWMAPVRLDERLSQPLSSYFSVGIFDALFLFGDQVRLVRLFRLRCVLINVRRRYLKTWVFVVLSLDRDRLCILIKLSLKSSSRTMYSIDVFAECMVHPSTFSRNVYGLRLLACSLLNTIACDTAFEVAAHGWL